MAALVAICGALFFSGLVLCYRGFTTPATIDSRPLISGKTVVKIKGLVTRYRRRLLIGSGAGIILFLITSWLVILLVTPIVVVTVWALLGEPTHKDSELLEALDRWVRTLAATLPTGASVVEAMRISKRQAPATLSHSLDLAIRRFDERWSVREALLAMADELASPDTDAVIAALILAAERGGTGATTTLNALADSLQNRLHAMREIETERAKPRIVVRQVTVITLVMLGFSLAVGRSFFEPFGTPQGQLVLAILLAAYVGSLAMLHTLTKPRRRERILRRNP
ncbi:MAG: type II secretion system F family protein [Propionibacteriaceae bacterium]